MNNNRLRFFNCKSMTILLYQIMLACGAVWCFRSILSRKWGGPVDGQWDGGIQV